MGLASELSRSDRAEYIITASYRDPYIYATIHTCSCVNVCRTWFGLIGDFDSSYLTPFCKSSKLRGMSKTFVGPDSRFWSRVN
jgi:hypothetical protein